MTLADDTRQILDTDSAGPDPVVIYGLGYLGEPEDYCDSPWKGWIRRLRDELTTEQLVGELCVSIEFLDELQRNLVSFDFARRHPLRIGKKDRLQAYRRAVRDLSQDDLAAEFKVNKSTVSRWLTGRREAPLPFLNRLENVEMERFGRTSAQADTLFLALTDDPLDDPESVENRLYQLVEFGMTVDNVTPEDLADLAGPLTPQAMTRIEKAQNTPPRTLA